jgi:putative transposase
MARLGRVVAPGVPHHVTQRGNRRRQQTVFNDRACARYVETTPVRAPVDGD